MFLKLYLLFLFCTDLLNELLLFFEFICYGSLKNLETLPQSFICMHADVLEFMPC